MPVGCPILAHSPVMRGDRARGACGQNAHFLHSLHRRV